MRKRLRGPRRSSLNVKEAAEYMGRSPKWVRDHASGLPQDHPDWIPYWKTANNQQGHLMFDPDDLDEWIERHRVGAE